MIDQRAISSIVATSILLIVTIISLVGFQQWENYYSNSIYINTENTDINSELKVETLVGNTLYINTQKNNISIKNIKVNGNSCNSNLSVKKGINNIDI